MNTRLLPLILASSLALATAAFAGPSALTKVTDKHIAELEALHTEAEKKIVVNDFRGAIKLYQDAILIEPDDEAAYTNMGHAYLILGDTGRAKDAFMNALAIDPDDETAKMGLRKIQEPEPLLAD